MRTLVRKKVFISETEIEKTTTKIIATHRFYSTVKNNFDIKPAISRLFFTSYWINGILFVLSSLANALYLMLFFYLDFKIKNSKIPENAFSVPWIGILILNLLVLFFLIHWINDSYKLSLRDKYRNNYLKLLWLDVLTLNFFNIIGILIFIKNKKYTSNMNIGNFETNNNINLQKIKDFSKIIVKIEIFYLLFNLIIFIITILIGYFISINIIKWICLFLILTTISYIQIWSFQKIFSWIILQKMLKNLVNNNNYYYLLTTIRFLWFNFTTYYIAVFINLVKDENLKELIIVNW